MQGVSLHFPDCGYTYGKETQVRIVGHMQVTLVAYYGTKPPYLSDFIRLCQDKLSEQLRAAFRPYEVEQVHATIVGLEGIRSSQGILNLNFLEARKEQRMVSVKDVMQLLTMSSRLPMSFRMGGYRQDCDYGFTSRGQQPYARSFSIQKDIVVSMGWPFDQERCTDSLYQLRHDLQEVGVLHKSHRSEQDFPDNDFYFVLGRVDVSSLPPVKIQETQELMRSFLAGIKPMSVTVDRANIFLVGYLDTQLPRSTSHAMSVEEATADVEAVEDLYPNTSV